MSEVISSIIKNMDNKIEKVIVSFKEKLKTINTGRANSSMLDGIKISYYGKIVPLFQLSTIAVPEPNLLSIQVWDKNIIKEVEKALMLSDLGLNPNSDGNIIRILIPKLTEERRKELVKNIKKIAEEYKIQIRNIRRDSNEEVKKLEKNNISKDIINDSINEIQKKTNIGIKNIEEILKNKEKSIMEF